MTDERRRLQAKRIQQSVHIGNEFIGAVILDIGRCVGAPVTALVRRNGPETGRGERGKLVPP